jgi:transketolase
MHYEARVGHIGGNLSALDLLLGLHHDVMGPDDAFVLSKGHAAGAMYVTLWSMGRLSDEDLSQFHQDGTRLGGHPPATGIPEILFATGSLGHGLSLAAGLALARKLTGRPGRAFCLLSDGEWNEGSNWEALIFAAHQKLDNLTLIIDANGLQGFGSTREVANLDPLHEKFRAFGLATDVIDGHDPDLIAATLGRSADTDHPGPRVVVAQTHKGCGVSFMQGKMEWHYLPMNEDQYRQALAEIQRPRQETSEYAQRILPVARGRRSRQAVRLPDRGPGVQGPGKSA